MAHWRLWSGRPGTYILPGIPPNVVRNFAIPLSGSALRVAQKHGRLADIYPQADLGDLSPRPAVLVDDEEGIAELEKAAEKNLATSLSLELS
ncbi:MAG: hypothetical protein WC992_00050 [Acholeplasmataceae bacterium]